MTKINFERIDRIVLESTLPRVFEGAENDAPVCNSQVWLRELTFARPDRYLVEAESGTGKSSLCSFIYGNRRDYKGTIRFNDVDISELSIADWCAIRRRHLALLPQDMKLFAELTALENIQIKNRLTGRLSKREILDMLDRLEIGAKANVPARRLSIGQQQRVAVIRTLAQPFDFVLLDEPVSHLDERNNRIVADLVTECAARNEAAIITTSVGNPLLLENCPTSVKL